MPRKIAAGSRNPSVVAWPRILPGAEEAGGASVGGGSAVMLLPLNQPPFAKDFLASFSSSDATPSTFFGFLRKSWKSLNSPCPTVPPNAAGCRSDISKRSVLALASATAVVRVIGSGYALGWTFLFGEEKPPRLVQISAASGVAR